MNYERLGSTFEEVGTLLSPSGERDQLFGSAVALGEGIALAGAAGDYLGKLYAFGVGVQESAIACEATRNSTGQPARLHQIGCPSLSSADLTLFAAPLPAHVTCVLFFGAPGIQRPLFDGVVCVARPLLRFAPQQANETGVYAHELDFTSPPASYLTAGTTWTFQALFADPGAGWSGFNLSDASSLTFLP